MTSNRPLEAVARLGRAFWAEPDTGTLLARAAAGAAEAFRADAAILAEHTPAGTLEVRASHGWDSAGRDLGSPSGHLARALQTADAALVVRDLSTETGLPPGVAAGGFRSAAVRAIGNPAHPFGVLAVYSRRRGAFRPAAAEALDALGASLGVALHARQSAAAPDPARGVRAHLASILDDTEDAIISATLDGAILSWNPGAERLYGYAASEIVGRDASVVVPVEGSITRQHLMGRVRAGERIPAFDAVHRRKDGTRVTVSLSLAPVRDAEGHVVAVAGVAQDVTAARRLESELRQSAKMEAVGRLAGGLAHDFNNMLTVIDGYSELLLIKLPADSPVRGLVEEIHRAGERAAELTRQLMVFSRKSMVEPSVLDLSAVVEEDVSMLSRVIGDDVTVETHLAGDLEHVMADRSLCEQALINLVINARDAMPEGGRVTIETSNVEFAAAHGIAPREVPAGQYVMLAVSDTGVGMDAATLPRIFEPFFTTKGSGRGTGLGLATVQTFVRQSGGYMTVYSEPGQGTTFKIYLPTVPLPLPPAQPVQAGEAPEGTETVLVVEDDDAVRVYTEAVLNAAGYEVLTAANGAEAVELARAAGRPIHLLMTDVVMPVLGGHGLAEQLSAEHAGLRVLFTSGYRPEAISRRGMVIPEPTFIQKPYSPAALCRKVRALLED